MHPGFGGAARVLRDDGRRVDGQAEAIKLVVARETRGPVEGLGDPVRLGENVGLNEGPAIAGAANMASLFRSRRKETR